MSPERHYQAGARETFNDPSNPKSTALKHLLGLLTDDQKYLKEAQLRAQFEFERERNSEHLEKIRLINFLRRITPYSRDGYDAYQKYLQILLDLDDLPTETRELVQKEKRRSSRPIPDAIRVVKSDDVPNIEGLDLDFLNKFLAKNFEEKVEGFLSVAKSKESSDQAKELNMKKARIRFISFIKSNYQILKLASPEFLDKLEACNNAFEKPVKDEEIFYDNSYKVPEQLAFGFGGQVRDASITNQLSLSFKK